MADITGYQTEMPTGLTGLDSTGAPTTPVNADNGQLLTQDAINTSVVSGTISVSTAQVNASKTGTNLVNRKTLLIMPLTGTIFLGQSGVTTTTGMPIFKNQPYELSFTDNVNIFLIAASAQTVFILEGS